MRLPAEGEEENKFISETHMFQRIKRNEQKKTHHSYCTRIKDVSIIRLCNTVGQCGSIGFHSIRRTCRFVGSGATGLMIHHGRFRWNTTKVS